MNCYSEPKTIVPDVRWQTKRNLFLAAIESSFRDKVADLLSRPNHGGVGLRAWLSTLVERDVPIPADIPSRLIQVYLQDPQAMPGHDCEDCGLAVPVRPTGASDGDDEPELVYFPTCPVCGGQTGLYAFYSKVDTTATIDTGIPSARNSAVAEHETLQRFGATDRAPAVSADRGTRGALEIHS